MNIEKNDDRPTSAIEKEKQRDIFSNLVRQEGIDPRYIYFNYPITLQAIKKIRYLEKLRLDAGSFVLDIGCFAGEYLRYVSARFGSRGIGVDISEACIRHCAEHDRKNCYIVADAENLPITSGVFDRVLLTAVLEHLPQQEKGISEAYRVLKRGGRCLMHIPVKDFGCTLFWIMHKIDPNWTERSWRNCGHNYATMSSLNEFLETLRKTGFRVIAAEKSGIIIQPLHDQYFMTFLSEVVYAHAKRFVSGTPRRVVPRDSKDTGAAFDQKDYHVGVFRKIYSKIFLPLLNACWLVERLITGGRVGYCAYIIAEKEDSENVTLKERT